jgi:hypothetical protein
MSITLWFVYLVIKYLIISNLFDPGYSRSRDRNDPRRDYFMLWHLSVQAVATILLFYYYNIVVRDTVIMVVFVEVVLQVLCTFIEREASMRYATRAYLGTWMVLLLGYYLIAWQSMVAAT